MAAARAHAPEPPPACRPALDRLRMPQHHPESPLSLSRAFPLWPLSPSLLCSQLNAPTGHRRSPARPPSMQRCSTFSPSSAKSLPSSTLSHTSREALHRRQRAVFNLRIRRPPPINLRPQRVPGYTELLPFTAVSARFDSPSSPASPRPLGRSCTDAELRPPLRSPLPTPQSPPPIFERVSVLTELPGAERVQHRPLPCTVAPSPLPAELRSPPKLVAGEIPAAP